MTISVDIYKSGIKLGSGTATNASASITSFTSVSGLTFPYAAVHANRNVQLVPTTGNNVGHTMNVRVLVDGTTSLTLADPVPFS